MNIVSENFKILALIPARGGSKGINHKNITNLGGHPLVAYSIAAAKQSGYINRIIVTTNDKKIAAVSQQYGAEAPFLRPGKISGDRSPDIDFFQHALAWLKKYEDYCPNLIVHLRPTTPLREFKIIDKAILEMIKDKRSTSLRSAEIIKRESFYKMFRKKGAYWDFFGKEDFGKDEEYYNYPRQKFPLTYQPNGYVDIIRPRTLFKTGLLHGKKIRAFITDKIVEIDRPEDLKSAKRLIVERRYNLLINEINKCKSKK